jgi:molybdopterin-containing oxidoreductase family iron-sulfur binding subunit
MSSPNNNQNANAGAQPAPLALTQISTAKPVQTGQQYWRSLDQLADTPEFREWVHREFPEDATSVLDGASRRKILKIMAASFGMAGLAACRRPVDHILPASKGIENYIPGKPLFYSSVFTQNGEAMGVLVEVNDGRPTKIEGNPDHPYSLGATSVFAQASVLGVYDPDRSQQVLEGGNASSWDSFHAFSGKSLSASALGQGDGLRFLSGRINSPSYRAVKAEALKKYPKAKWVEYDPFAPENVLEGTHIAFGQPLTPHYAFDKADVIVSLDSDFIGYDTGTVLPTRQFSSRRRLTDETSTLNRLYVVESQFTTTGGVADHRLRLKPSEIASFAADLAAAVEGAAPAGTDKRSKWIAAVSKDLKANQGKSIVIAGPNQPATVHALAFSINQALANTGATVTFTKPVHDLENSGIGALKALAQELDGGQVKTLIILGGNPVFTAPYDLHLGDSIKKAAISVHLGLEANETAAVSKWHLPEAHYLESWGDALSSDGTAAVQQPMIEPIYSGKSQVEVVAALIGYKDQRGIDIVSNYWKGQWKTANATDTWNKALNDGIIAGQKLEAVKVSLDAAKVKAAAVPKPSGAALEVLFRPSYTLGDGSYANNAWCQELPDPVTKFVWGNAALVSPATAKRLNLADGEIVNFKRGSFIVEMPVAYQPGQADDTVTVILGYGRDAVGHVGKGVGYNGYPLRTTTALNIATDITLEKTSGKLESLATTQNHNSMEGRPIVRETSLEKYKKNPEIIQAMAEVPELFELYPETKWDKGNQWGMAIDLTSCTGCNSCIIACQAENNIPVVGKDQVQRGRAMHWVRLDRYYTGPVDEPEMVHQVVPCMQCENAPCENVCPVAATVHDDEGLNAMTYNRCVGTRYCMNNCPYKVRRFNFLNWHRDITEVEKLVFNPDVTVRMRGVMEKCTYCVQRIQEAKISAKTSGRRPDENNRIQYADGEIQTACQQTCAAGAIVFGDISDPNSRVSKLKKQERNYAMLAELNVRPRTTYLAQVRNTNSELA